MFNAAATVAADSGGGSSGCCDGCRISAKYIFTVGICELHVIDTEIIPSSPT